MNPLTLEYAVTNKLSGIDLVKYFKPDISNEYADLILWNYTCFPMDIEQVIEQLNDMYLNPSTP